MDELNVKNELISPPDETYSNDFDRIISDLGNRRKKLLDILE